MALENLQNLVQYKKLCVPRVHQKKNILKDESWPEKELIVEIYEKLLLISLNRAKLPEMGFGFSVFRVPAWFDGSSARFLPPPPEGARSPETSALTSRNFSKIIPVKPWPNCLYCCPLKKTL